MNEFIPRLINFPADVYSCTSAPQVVASLYRSLSLSLSLCFQESLTQKKNMKEKDEAKKKDYSKTDTHNCTSWFLL